MITSHGTPHLPRYRIGGQNQHTTATNASDRNSAGATSRPARYTEYRPAHVGLFELLPPIQQNLARLVAVFVGILRVYEERPARAARRKAVRRKRIMSFTNAPGRTALKQLERRITRPGLINGQPKRNHARNAVQDSINPPRPWRTRRSTYGLSTDPPTIFCSQTSWARVITSVAITRLR